MASDSSILDPQDPRKSFDKSVFRVSGVEMSLLIAMVLNLIKNIINITGKIGNVIAFRLRTPIEY